MSTLTFKGYQGSVELDKERGRYRGKLLSIDDLITYVAATQSELRTEFEAAVDDYITTCRELGRASQRPHQRELDNLKRNWHLSHEHPAHVGLWRFCEH